MKYVCLIKPGSSQEKIIKNDDNLIVYLRKRAHDGEANEALIKVLAKYFRVGKTRIKIVQGIKTRNKIIEILE